MAVFLKTLAQVVVCNGGNCSAVKANRVKNPYPEIQARWFHLKLWKEIGLAVNGCIGLCDLSTIVYIIMPTQTVWLKEMNTERDFDALIAWAAECNEKHTLVALSDELKMHEFDRLKTVSLT